jgi:hypothetical protein
MFVLLAVGCFLAIAAGLAGIADNPPGILLAFGAVAAFVVAFVHHWRTARQFRFLAYAAGLGFGFFAIVHNVFEGLAGGSGELAAVRVTLQGLGVAAFLIAILICPPALVVGAVGALAMWIRSRFGRNVDTPA